ncbi:hypothetical protein [Microbacterium sp. ZXX196]|uniref:hypothetical protein n=1 Tax=Microbacterium sp. ZXX196 TaxID=2609291 RepID=UPI0018AD0D3F|nr:hypothetical protein [Microbacterium sp. ZXX196]
MRVLQLGVGEVAHHARQERRPEADEERGHRDDDDRPHPAGVDLTARQCGQQGARKLHDRDERDDAADRADHAQGDDASKAAAHRGEERLLRRRAAVSFHIHRDSLAP